MTLLLRWLWRFLRDDTPYTIGGRIYRRGDMGDTENLKLLLERYPSIVRQAAFTAMGATHESPEAVAELATLLREFALRHSGMCRARDQRN